MQDIQKKEYRLCILQCPISECGNFFEKKKTLILKDSLISQQTKKKHVKRKLVFNSP